jgi:mannose-6-phosphate isomerase-like protein (cupin superfamily)
MKADFPTAEEYSAERARYPALSVVDIRAVQAGISDAYRNQVLLDVNTQCLRLAVFEGQYRWHYHPDSDELFLVVAGELRIELEGGDQVTLTEWQSMVVPARTIHRTRAVGRTVNLTCEKQGAQTVFVEGPESRSFKAGPQDGSV